MKATKPWIVSKTSGVRPAGRQDECFYCHEKVGETHKTDCVIRNRTVVVATTIYHVVSVPESWTEEEINFHRNESSSCASNIVQELRQLFDYRDDFDTCFCDEIQSNYVEEASAEEEEKSGLYINKNENLPNYENNL